MENFEEKAVSWAVFFQKICPQKVKRVSNNRKMINNFFYLYQHLPSEIDPIVFAFGPISLTWYSLMYLVGFCVIYGLLVYRLRKENNSQFAFIDRDLLVDFLFYAFIGLLIGARLGYVLFYNLSFFLDHPLAIISPFDKAGNLVGIYGMSYHGGLIDLVLIITKL